MSAAELCCPICAAELTIEQLFSHVETRQAFSRLATLSLPLGARLLTYIGLFAPAKNRMALARKVKLIEELLPEMERGAIDRRGRTWKTSHDDWRNAIDQILDARHAGKLRLPLTSHGYLFEILASLVDKVEAEQERHVEQERQHRQVAPQASHGAHVSDLVGKALSGLPPSPPPDPEAAARGRQIREQLLSQKRARDATKSNAPTAGDSDVHE